jgi:hypothetical protein
MAAFDYATPSFLGDDETDPMTPLLTDRRYAIPPPAYLKAAAQGDASLGSTSDPSAIPFVTAAQSDAPVLSALGAPAAPTGPVPPSRYDAALSKLEAALGERPTLSKPKWWQSLAGAAAGFGAGWSNAAGRTRHPIDIDAMRQNILYPGYSQKMAEWQSRIEPLQQMAQLEGTREQMETNRAWREAEAEAARQHGLYWAHRSQMEQNQWRPVPGEKGWYMNTITGERRGPTNVEQERFDHMKALGASDDEARYYAANGSMAGYGSTLANPDKPGVVLPAGGEYLDPHTGKVLRTNPREFAPQREPAEKTASPRDFARVENEKATQLAQAEARARKRLDAGEDPDLVNNDLLKEKQQAQNNYENQVTALGGSVQHFEYGSRPASGQTAPASKQQYTEADVRAAAKAKRKDPDAAVALARKRRLIP